MKPPEPEGLTGKQRGVFTDNETLRT